VPEVADVVIGWLNQPSAGPVADCERGCTLRLHAMCARNDCGPARYGGAAWVVQPERGVSDRRHLAEDRRLA